MRSAQAIPLYQKAAAGLTAGGLGALVGSPADLSLIRMQVGRMVPCVRLPVGLLLMRNGHDGLLQTWLQPDHRVHGGSAQTWTPRFRGRKCQTAKTHELCTVQADSTLPIERRRNYKSVVDALVRCASCGLRKAWVMASSHGATSVLWAFLAFLAPRHEINEVN